MKTKLTCLLLVSLLWCLSMDANAQSGLPVVRVGIVVDGPWGRNEAILSEFQQEIVTLTEREFDVRFPDSKFIVGDFSIGTVRAAIDRLLADEAVDMVLALGALASQDASTRGPLPKPVIAAFVIDPAMQGIPVRNGASGVRNLNYLTMPNTLERDVETFQEITPFSSLAVLANGYLASEIPGLTEGVISEITGVEATVVPVGASLQDALDLLPEGVEATYLFPLLQLPEASFTALVDSLNGRGIPSFAYLGREDVERGVLAGLTADLFPRLTRRVALNFQSILLGAEPGDIPTAFSAGERLYLNVETAERIGKYPGWGVITEAELVGESRAAAERFYTLQSVMVDAVAVNLDLLAAGHFVASGEEGVNLARSFFLPRINLSGSGLLIDQDRARAGVFGAERSLSGSATLTQVVLNDPVFANYSVEGHLQDSREADWNGLRLDVARQAGSAYLNVLRAGTLEEIRRNNLQLSRTNLDLARVRVSTGQSPASDIYRWESEIANSRREAISASATRNVAEIELNRVLNRPLEEPFDLEPMLVDDPSLLLDDYPYLVYFRDKISFRAFREFLVREAISWSPEIQALDAGIAAVERSRTSAGREFWLPKLGVFGSINHIFARGGEGSEPLPVFDIRTTWEAGAQLDYPLLEGGGKFAASRQASEELARIQVERQSTMQRIEQRVRSALHRAGASFAGIEQALRASGAALNNLNLVTDSYSRGTVSIIELIDAQNAYIVADENAAAAVYDFLLDAIEAQRSIGRYDYMLSDEERDDFDTRLREFMEARGIQR